MAGVGRLSTAHDPPMTVISATSCCADEQHGSRLSLSRESALEEGWNLRCPGRQFSESRGQLIGPDPQSSRGRPGRWTADYRTPNVVRRALTSSSSRTHCGLPTRADPWASPLMSCPSARSGASIPPPLLRQDSGRSRANAGATDSVVVCAFPVCQQTRRRNVCRDLAPALSCAQAVEAGNWLCGRRSLSNRSGASSRCSRAAMLPHTVRVADGSQLNCSPKASPPLPPQPGEGHCTSPSCAPDAAIPAFSSA
jgi:hypothetical protein